MTMPEPKIPFLLRMAPELHAKVRERAEKRGVSMNEWVNLALVHNLERTGDKIVRIERSEYEL